MTASSRIAYAAGGLRAFCKFLRERVCAFQADTNAAFLDLLIVCPFASSRHNRSITATVAEPVARGRPTTAWGEMTPIELLVEAAESAASRHARERFFEARPLSR